MNITNAYPLLLPLLPGLLDSLFNQQLLQAISLICEPHYPKHIVYGGLQPPSLEYLPDRYLQHSTEPRTIISDIDRVNWPIPIEACLMLFLDEATVLDLTKSIAGHRMLVVTSAIPSEHTHRMITLNSIFDVFFVTINESHFGVYYHGHSLEHRWTQLTMNTQTRTFRDMAGSGLMSTVNNEDERLFARFVAAEMNATLDLGNDRSSRACIFYSQLLTEPFPNSQLIYMHRTSGLRALVPKLDERLPMISVMVDPFDVETWTLYGAMILTVAFFRMCCSRRFTLRQYFRSIQDIASCLVQSLPIRFHRLVEQVVVAFPILLNVVLMTAYSSLVISFLLNPRVHPELDTLDQLNDSCCWWWALNVESLAFRHAGDCLSVTVDKDYSPKVADRGRFECYLIEPTVESLMAEMDPGIARHYRWSRETIQPYPVMALATGGVGLVKWIRFFASVYFAEGGLHTFFRGSSEQSIARGNNEDRSIMVEDLGLLWWAFCWGIVISLVVFIGELLRSSRIWSSKFIGFNRIR